MFCTIGESLTLTFVANFDFSNSKSEFNREVF